jgi:hypothetical protein
MTGTAVIVVALGEVGDARVVEERRWLEEVAM